MNKIVDKRNGTELARGRKTLKELVEKNHVDLSYADLRGADLRYANLKYVNLSCADLRDADLRYANLGGANLWYADLGSAKLEGVNLRGAKIKFQKFPSIRLLSSIMLYDLPNDLTLELMRRDAFAHPYPEKFDEWSKDGPCPYENEESFWQFSPKKQLWRKGKPQMRDSDLIIEICKSQGWKIREI